MGLGSSLATESTHFYLFGISMQVSEPTVPTLLYLLCAMSAMAFLLSAYIWLWRAAYGENKLDFKPSIYRGQLYSLLNVMVLSIVFGGYDRIFYGSDLHIGGEVFVLLLAFVYVYAKAGGGSRVSFVLIWVKRLFSFGAFCIFGWVLTLSFGLLISYALGGLGFISLEVIDPNVVFIVGLLWVVPIIILYIKIIQNPDRKTVLGGRGFHKFLWPVLMAYMVLLFPLLMQQISVSEKWRDMKNEKPMRSA